MAFYDWNHDGKKDWQDDFYEYQIYEESTKDSNKSSYTSSSGGGISTFGAIVSTIGGLFLLAFIVTLFGGDGSEMPVLLIIILWAVCSSVLAVICEHIGL